MVPHSFRVSPLQAAVLLHNVMQCEDAENDADRTVQEICAGIDGSNGHITKGLLESALYCCNMEHERGQFWHPLNQNFDKFVAGILNKQLHFDRYYNVIYEVKNAKKA